MAAMMLTASACLLSCNDDDDNYIIDNRYPNAIVTLRNDVNGKFFLQLNDSTAIYPTNMDKSPYGQMREMRALCNLNINKVPQKEGIYTAYVNWLDTIRTKYPAPYVDNADAVYGNDPIEIVNDWTTTCEDGFLNLRFRTYFGNSKQHSINLMETMGDKNGLVFELRHNANGDKGTRVGDGLIAFNLNYLLNGGGQKIDVTLRWKSFSGWKSKKFVWHPRRHFVFDPNL